MELVCCFARPPRSFFKESLIVLFALKPGVDAMRVASGREHEEGALFSPQVELVATKLQELVFEAVPGCVFQFYVLVVALSSNEHVGKQALVSLLVSALSAGYLSSTITWDYDTSYARRKNEPELYGLVGDGSRGSLLFLLMVLMSSLIMLGRCAAIALLIRASPLITAAYLLSDQLLFFFQRWIRNDFHFFLNLDGLWGLLGADLAIPFCLKTITDFTGLLQFRLPAVMGGVYWT
jgi:hypothetical protein